MARHHIARASRKSRASWPKVAVVVASAAVLVAGTLPAPAHAARALMQQQQPQAAPQSIGDLLGALGLGNNGNTPQNPQNNNNLASVINRAIAQGAVPPQQRIQEDDGTNQTTETMSAQDGNARSSASATGDVTSVDAGADDGNAQTQQRVTRRNNSGIRGDDDVAQQEETAVQPATSAARAASSSSSRASASASAVSTTLEDEAVEDDLGDSPDAPQDFDETDGEEVAAGAANANSTNPDVAAGLQQAAAGVNGTYGVLSGLLSNLTGGALQLPPLDTTGNGNSANDPNAAPDRIRSAPVEELKPGVVGSSASKASASFVAAAAGGMALAAMMML